MIGRTILILFPTIEEARFALDPRENEGPLVANVSTGLSHVRQSILPCSASFFDLTVYQATCNAQGAEIEEIARELIADIRPALVILPGIVGSAVGRDVGIGDVIISDEILYPIREKNSKQVTGRYDRFQGELSSRLARRRSR